MTTTATDDTLLEVTDLAVHFPLPRSRPFGPVATVRAVDGVSFKVRRGRTFGIVGESGSGKTTTAQAVMGLVGKTRGTVHFEGTARDGLAPAAQRLHRRGYQMIFQDPFSSLNPRLRVDQLVREPLDLMDVGAAGERKERVAAMLDAVGLRADQHALFPHQFSGGQRQRISIARALASNPKLVVCDEPVSALDVAIQAQILNLLARLEDELALTYLFISHDLHVVRYLCDDIAVMYLGRIVEQTRADAIFEAPLHPYTWALVSAIPGNAQQAGGRARVTLRGDPPSPTELPTGCRFAARCQFAETQCLASEPQLRSMPGDRLVACHRVDADGIGPQHLFFNAPEPLPCRPKN
ncbi:ABC transporter ATP-binding protein [Variovorax sp. PAMC 28711]|uniref:ABC transporter ATP-binding protein n=1 Tax=Variovorax sp. PAMC 28711 TaxID=1795631 RepID=UPI00078E164B|nr:oligopeptide/dipeptide ABC transporter ATP-binding protein [Variovorax sp. PAMC 28711]AMM26361.1 peptide ABC transporter ATP-binding protein [Variovorax sp. PAMC 28711]